MRITRVFHDAPLAVGETLRLSGEEAHYVFKVLRGRPGDGIEVVDGEGKLLLAELTGDREAAVLEERPDGFVDDGALTLYQAVPKGRHMDLVVEKATELGVGRIVPLATERGLVKLSRGDVKIERWRRVALAASRQSLRLRVPDRPGSLARLLTLVGQTGANLIEVQHVREGVELHVRETAVELVLETRGRDHAGEVLECIEKAGYGTTILR